MSDSEEKPAPPLSVLDHLMEGCKIIDPTWRYVYLNEAAARQGRRPVAALVGQRIQDLFPGIEHTPLFASLARCMETRVHDRLVSEFVYPDGSSAWYELRLEPVPEGLFIMSLDLTAQRAAESALRDRDTQLRMFSETIPDPIFMKDREGRWTFANPAALWVVGRPAGEALGKTERELYADPAVAEALMTTDRRVMERGVAEVLEEVVQTPDGYRTYLTTKVPFRDEAGRVVGLMGNARDITARKAAESRVARLSQLYQTVCDIDEAMLRATDEHDLFQHVCDITLRLGDFASVWIGTVDAERGEIVPQFAAGELAPRILRATFPLEREHPARRPIVADVFLHGETRVMRDLDGDALDARWAAMARAVGVRAVASVPLRRGGAVIGALTLNSRTQGDFDPEVVTLLEAVARTTSAALDNLARIDALREREAQLRMAQKMEAIGRLAGGVAHDFNNILCVIGSYADLAMDRARVDPTLVADLEEIQAAGKRAEALTRQLLAFSRKQVLQPEVLSLNALVESVEKMLRRLIGEDIALRFTPGDDLWLARVDPGQIEQVLMNLAVNARDAMPSGGKLTIETANVSLTDDDVAQRLELRAGDFVALTVTDDGVGMDEAIRARIFEPFFTTKGPGQGTGLGLAMVYGIVKQSGGTVAVTSAPGEGARFEIYFPREQALPVTNRPATAASRRPRGHETVLVVEDEERVRGLVRRILHTSGYRVLSAANADEAVRCCEGAGASVDLLLTDIVMPGMNGRDLAARITAARPHVRVLFMSGYTDDAIAARGALAPGTRFIGKPFNAEDLTRRVRAALDEA